MPDWVEEGDGEVASLERGGASPGRGVMGRSLLVPAAAPGVVAGDGEVVFPDWVDDGEGEVASLERGGTSPGRGVKGRSLPVPAAAPGVVAGDGEVVFPDWVEDGEGEVASLDRLGPLIAPDDRPEGAVPLLMPADCTSSADSVCASSSPDVLRPWDC